MGAARERPKKIHLVTTRLSQATLEKIERIVDEEGRPRADVVRRLVEKSLRSEEGEED